MQTPDRITRQNATAAAVAVCLVAVAVSVVPSAGAIARTGHVGAAVCERDAVRAVAAAVAAAARELVRVPDAPVALHVGVCQTRAPRRPDPVPGPEPSEPAPGAPRLAERLLDLPPPHC